MLRLQQCLLRALPGLSILSLVTGREARDGSALLSLMAWGTPCSQSDRQFNTQHVNKFLVLPIPWVFPLKKTKTVI